MYMVIQLQEVCQQDQESVWVFARPQTEMVGLLVVLVELMVDEKQESLARLKLMQTKRRGCQTGCDDR